MSKSTQDTIKTELWDFAKSVGKLVAAGLASNAITKHVVPKANVIGKTMLDKMANFQGKKDAEALDELARQSEELQKKQSASPVQNPPAPTPPLPTTPKISDGPVEAKFAD